MNGVCILMITYNRLEFTKETIRSLNRNTKFPFKLIIVDNGSTDKTRKFLFNLNENIDCDVYFSSKNMGTDRVMNWLFENFDCEFYSKVDNDSIVPLNWLVSLKDELERYNLDVIGARHYTMSDRAKQDMDEVARMGHPKISSVVGGSGILIKKSFISKYGIIDVKNKLFDNWTDHQYKTIKEGARISFSSSIFMDLLDMEDHFKRKEVYLDYNKEMENKRR